MKSAIRDERFLAWFLAVFTLFSAAFAIGQGTFSVSPEPPEVGPLDIANYAPHTGTFKWWLNEPSQGQTFTTGDTTLRFRALTYRTRGSAPDKTFVVRIGKVDGNTFTEIYSETIIQEVAVESGAYSTWTLANPVELSPNTKYGVDVGLTHSTSGWQEGIPYLSHTGNEYADGARYMSGERGMGTDTLNVRSGEDAVFHMHFDHPMEPSPDIGVTVPSGAVSLTWTNQEPHVGDDVRVNLWFGTDPENLEQLIDGAVNATTGTVNAPVANTYYWRVDTYLDGADRKPLMGDLFSFIVDDTDGDGMPDWWEIKYFGGPTTANPDDDPDGDGLTNLQEYQMGLNPIDPDTDGDGLLDGGNIVVTSADARYTDFVAAGIYFTDDGPERTFYGEAHFGTDPLDIDTDNDGLLDGDSVTVTAADPRYTEWAARGIAHFDNGGQRTFRGEIAMGTDPLNPDTDGDGLLDGVESNTGIYIGPHDTGTDPLNPDTDGDGAGDWYEVHVTYTDPNDPADNPGMPYPLPAPDPEDTGSSDKPVKVYILSGQSNMVGFGTPNGTAPGTLERFVTLENKFPNLHDGSGWVARQDVHYRGVIAHIGKGPLAPTFGNFFGPELGFGHVMGWYHDEPVLLIKSSMGNRSLGWDILPPGSDPVDWPDGYTYAGYGQSPMRWETDGGGPGPGNWYAGKQYDDFFVDEADMGPKLEWTIGVKYPNNCTLRHNGELYISRSAHTASAASEPGVGGDWQTFWSLYSIFNVTDVLDNFAAEYPQWAEQGFEIAGFAWWQGHKDGGEAGSGTAGVHALLYEENLARLITSLRDYYENRYPGKVLPDAPFVVATVAFGGGATWEPGSSAQTIFDAQMAVSDPARHPQFDGNVASVDARSYWRPSEESPSGVGFHYNHNAETYLLTGDALGRAMVEMLEYEKERQD